ncbi:MAG: DUF433 domain-containing protein [Frankia sp.]
MEVSVLNREIYSIGEAARRLTIGPQRLRGWIDGYSRGGRVYEPVIRPERTGSDIVTWGEFVEAGYLREYRDSHKVSLQRLRPFVQDLRERLGVPYPLAHATPYVANRELVLQIQEANNVDRALSMVVWRNGQLVLAPHAEKFVEKVEFAAAADNDGPAGAGEVVRIFPDGPSSPVAIDPLLAFGAPAIGAIRTENLYELFEAGESMMGIAHGYDLPLADVEAAIRYEGRGQRQESAV